jgi:hypothetical protein
MTQNLTELNFAVGQRRGCPFLDEATVAETFATDGVLLDALNTRIMGATITDLKKTRLL